MRRKIRAPRDFWAGCIYLVVGFGSVSIATQYQFGSAARMGPGYFPTILGAMLILFGGISVVRGLTRTGERIGMIAVKPLVLILGGPVAFGLLLPRIGLPLALVTLILICAAASSRFRLAPLAIALMAILVAFCTIVFAYFLGVPLPLRGDWLAWRGN